MKAGPCFQAPEPWGVTLERGSGRRPKRAPTQLSLGLEGEEIGVPWRGRLQLGSPLALEQEDKDNQNKTGFEEGKNPFFFTLTGCNFYLMRH